jgi:hypothetical protein
MSSLTETLLEFRVIQLEGKLLLYESLTAELSKIEIVQKAASEAKLRMEEILKVRNKNGEQ